MSEIQTLLNMNYDDCCNFLKNKYGIINGSYFATNTFKSINSKIKRSKDGLYIHHIDEDKAIMLSTKKFALNNPYSYQQGDRLVYCNLLEHLVLHIKIFQFPHKDKNKNESVGVGGICNFIIPELNDIYSGIEYQQEWKKAIVKNVIDLEDDYLKCIKFLNNLGFWKIKEHVWIPSLNFWFGNWKIDNNKKIIDKIKKIID